MNTTKIVVAALLALTAFAGVASADGPYTVTKAAISPGTVDIQGVAILGAAACQNAVGSVPLFCGGGGLGAFIFTNRGASAVTDAPIEPGLVEGVSHHHHAFATGTCDVATSTPGVGTVFFFSCGVDRNNDSIVTDAPVCDIEQTVANFDECTGGQPESWADDWVNGDNSSPPVPFCFQDGVRGFTDDPSDDDGTNDVSAFNTFVSPVEHGDGWASDITVFVGAVVPNTASFVGVTTVTVAGLTGAAACGAATGGDVSAHSTGGNANTDGNGRATPECSDSIDNSSDADTDIDDADANCLSGPGGTYNADDNDESA